MYMYIHTYNNIYTSIYVFINTRALEQGIDGLTRVKPPAV